MNRFTLLALALFASACATDIDANVEDNTDGFRASLEETDANTERRSSRRGQRIVDSVLNEYGPLAETYGCDIISVISGSWSDRDTPILATVFDLKGRSTSRLIGAMQMSSRSAGSIHGSTSGAPLHGVEYVLHGMVDGTVIEADFIAQSNLASIPDYLVFADRTTRGTGGSLKGVVVDCD
jgi:hypothetical protein